MPGAAAGPSGADTEVGGAAQRPDRHYLILLWANAKSRGTDELGLYGTAGAADAWRRPCRADETRTEEEGRSAPGIVLATDTGQTAMLFLLGNLRQVYLSLCQWGHPVHHRMAHGPDLNDSWRILNRSSIGQCSGTRSPGPTRWRMPCMSPCGNSTHNRHLQFWSYQFSPLT